uniref:Uncharacterized protein n=1 Tax=Romanomermis culicivorax TaxID=13658 RepID=A0A915KP95_ROMCU
MLKRVELELHGKKPDEIDELNLDNCKSTAIEGITDEFVNLKRLSIINAGLQSLKGFPKLPNLERLDLSDNRISGGLEHLQNAEKLARLKLSGNKICSLDCIEALKQLKNLQSLDLFNCEITKAEDYRSKVFEILPSLVYLDETDKMNRSCATDEDESDDEEENGEESNAKPTGFLLFSDVYCL